MKFKQSDGQNQRIERITTPHLVVGIDMAKETQVAQATNYRGIVLTNQHLSFKNTIQGFEKLLRWIVLGCRIGSTAGWIYASLSTLLCLKIGPVHDP
ncbi:hypothetical protein [Paenibacillus plantarum]|uniref:hypothetical protein n=1 Tax=Paenibacillus plantarum TaxID=2654975 RepID=UPI001FE93E8D|nr:hypothetical protein [Paenibacillus plantarum]